MSQGLQAAGWALDHGQTFCPSCAHERKLSVLEAEQLEPDTSAQSMPGPAGGVVAPSAELRQALEPQQALEPFPRQRGAARTARPAHVTAAASELQRAARGSATARVPGGGDDPDAAARGARIRAVGVARRWLAQRQGRDLLREPRGRLPDHLRLALLRRCAGGGARRPPRWPTSDSPRRLGRRQGADRDHRCMDADGVHRRCCAAADRALRPAGRQDPGRDRRPVVDACDDVRGAGARLREPGADRRPAALIADLQAAVGNADRRQRRDQRREPVHVRALRRAAVLRHRRARAPPVCC